METYKIQFKNLNCFYQQQQVLFNINLNLPPNSVTSIIGPSGSGKSSLLRTINRLYELIPGSYCEGEIILDYKNVLSADTNVLELRKKIGMVFQKPNPFPQTVFENVSFPLRVKGIKHKQFLEERVERTLKMVGLWDEVKGRLHKSALRLSGGQQQRLCIARAIAAEPTLILMDEPTSSLDPISTAKIEELIYKLKKEFTIIIVTHNMQQAARTSDITCLLNQGVLIECQPTHLFFTRPEMAETLNFITGRNNL